jgi:hypothetical protein
LLVDPDKSSWSPLNEFTWNGEDILDELFFENFTDVVAPGLGAHINCHMGLNNLLLGTASTDSAGLHRSLDPAVGSFSHLYKYSNVARKEIAAGEEFFISYGENWFIDREHLFGMIPFEEEYEISDHVGLRLLPDVDAMPADVWDFIRHLAKPRLQIALPKNKEDYKDISSRFGGSTARASCPNSVRSPQWLKENGHCIDRLYAANSTIREAGRGGFVKIAFSEGEVVTVSPLIHFHHDHTLIKRQSTKNGKHIFSIKVTGTQQLVNYAFSQDDSDVFMVPYAPIVNFINHNTRGSPNVFIRWSSSRYNNRELLKLPADELLSNKYGLMIEYVALRDLAANEEIFIDYGESWVQAWEHHVKNFKPIPGWEDYISATDFNTLYGHESIRTQKEQETNPYPSNLQTACHYLSRYDENNLSTNFNTLTDDLGNVEVRSKWSTENNGCLRPCSILNRSSNSQLEYYTAVMADLPNELQPSHYILGDDKHIVYNIPRVKVMLLDKAYTTDIHNANAFRHPISVPEGMFPAHWSRDWSRRGAVVLSKDLEPGQIEQMKLPDDEEEISEFAYTIGVSTKLTEMLLEYCNRMGITDRFKDLLYTKAHEPGIGTYEDFHGLQWYVQRPDNWWNSNMHWISPADAGSHEDYLRLLGESGFNELLEAVGERFGWEGLVCFHVTFIGVSECDEGYPHYDFHDTGGKGFNMIIPLILVNDSKAELDVHADSGEFVATYKYRKNVASMLGDNAIHSTSSINYTSTKEFRMAATVYISDVHPGNVENIMSDYTQAYPPRDPKLLLRDAGKHWVKGKSAKLPNGPKVFKSRE